MAERRGSNRQRWTASAAIALEEHGATESGRAEHYRNVWTWMPEDDRPPSAITLLALLLDGNFGRDTNELYFWTQP